MLSVRPTSGQSKARLMRNREFGLLVCEDDCTTPGLTLFSPLYGKSGYLIDLRGEVARQWDHPVTSIYGYLLDSGNLLWSGTLAEGPQRASVRIPMPPCATRSSNTLVGRR